MPSERFLGAHLYQNTNNTMKVWYSESAIVCKIVVIVNVHYKQCCTWKCKYFTGNPSEYYYKYLVVTGDNTGFRGGIIDCCAELKLRRNHVSKFNSVYE